LTVKGQQLRWNGSLDPDIISHLPAGRGSYALFLSLTEAVHLTIGRLGAFDFLAGGYVYLGSAHGPGGLRARLAHHARIEDHLQWHLDYFRPFAQITGGFISEEIQAGALPLECAWSQQFLRLPGALPAVPGFGSADCRRGCPAHLIWLPHSLLLSNLQQLTLPEWLQNCYK
jgi:Uri superfamily endonuclease